MGAVSPQRATLVIGLVMRSLLALLLYQRRRASSLALRTRTCLYYSQEVTRDVHR